MELACRSTTNHNRNVKPCFLHLLGHVDHLFQRRGYQSAKAYHVGLFSDGFSHDLLRGHHYAEVYHVIVVAGHHHTHDVLPDVVHIALHRG